MLYVIEVATFPDGNLNFPISCTSKKQPNRLRWINLNVSHKQLPTFFKVVFGAAKFEVINVDNQKQLELRVKVR